MLEEPILIQITGKDTANFYTAHFLKTLEIKPTYPNKFSKLYCNGYISKQCKVNVEINKIYKVLKYSVSAMVRIDDVELVE
jgi:hypothetical protein